MTDLALVLLPGLDGSGVLFRPLVASLAPSLRPVVVSFPPDRPLGYDELLPIVEKALPRGSRFLVLGESFSGPLALLLAARRPEGLAGVVLCATFVRSPLPVRSPWLAYLVHPAPFRLFPAFTMTKTLLTGYSSPSLRALTAEALSEVRPEVLAHRLRCVFRVDVRRELVDCPVPVLYLRGERDLVVPAHNLREITRLLPTVEVARIAAPHLVLQTRPAESAAALEAFATRVTGDGPAR